MTTVRPRKPARPTAPRRPALPPGTRSSRLLASGGDAGSAATAVAWMSKTGWLGLPRHTRQVVRGFGWIQPAALPAAGTPAAQPLPSPGCSTPAHHVSLMYIVRGPGWIQAAPLSAPTPGRSTPARCGHLRGGTQVSFSSLSSGAHGPQQRRRLSCIRRRLQAM